jgi:hypothetical protein
MRKKIIISVVLCLFAGLTVLNIGLTHRPDNTDTTLDLISVMVKAFDEGEGTGATTYCVKCMTQLEVLIGHVEYSTDDPDAVKWKEVCEYEFGDDPPTQRVNYTKKSGPCGEAM